VHDKFTNGGLVGQRLRVPVEAQSLSEALKDNRPQTRALH
jgi:hypothetical protein